MTTVNIPEIVIRNRSAGMLMAGDLVLLQRVEADNYWSLPGGGIDRGESSLHAFMREMREELDWMPRKARLVGLIENLFATKGRTYQECGFYYTATADELYALHGKPDTGFEFRAPEARLILSWFSVKDISGLDIRPHILKEWLIDPSQPFEHRTLGF
jgi:8-oxo-dGTP pyrophosphatase MutT (NUDIX family)